jgi:hypothetical protein
MTESTSEKAALVWIHYCNGLGMFRTTCEVIDTEDPQNKIFRFREGCNWGMWDGSKKPSDVRELAIYSHWSEWDVGKEEGDYRVTATRDIPAGYIAVLEGTTKPEIRQEYTPAVNDIEQAKCELAIMAALESEPRMTLRTLKRKVSAHRFAGAWDGCFKKLTDEGEIQVEADPAMPQRTWVTLAASVRVDCISGSNGNADNQVAD